jgi:hypothetical protein
MAIGLDPGQVAPSEELLMCQVDPQEAAMRLLVEKGIFAKEGCLKTVDVLSVEIEKIERAKKRLEAYDHSSQPLDF